MSALLFVSALAAPLPAQTRVIILGTGTPNPDPERSGPAVAVVAGTTAYLVDAGPGVVRRAALASERHHIQALEAHRLGLVFLTHLHSDHTVGLPDVIHTGWVAGRTAPLRVYGPPGTAAMARNLTEAWQADIDVRTKGKQPHTDAGWQVAATDITGPGVVYRDSNMVVRAFRVPHTDWPVSYGYRFEARDRVIVVSGDTRASDAVVQACARCDVLVHEVYNGESFRGLPPAWRRYHSDSHTSTVELARLARAARPGLLVLYHQLYWGGTDADLLRQVRAAGYTGRVVAAKDLDVFP